MKNVHKVLEKLKPLYKKNQEGKIQVWTVFLADPSKEGINVTVQFGELKGKIQEKKYKVTAGKNTGKKNETSVFDQAVLEAQSKWEKKLKSGYVTSLKDAEAGKLDSIIKGGLSPMLAHSYEKYQDKVEFPCYVQPKLDGQRCIAMRDSKGKVTLWTRTRKQIHSCPHIIEQVEKMLSHFGPIEVALDGELYHHDLKDQFEELMSAVRKDKPSEESSKIEYHVYDFAIHPNGAIGFEGRLNLLESLPDYFSHVNIVQTSILHNHKELELAHDHMVDSGYEGLMVRSVEGLYEGKRSKHLLKFKKFQDAEFSIQGVLPGKDNTVVFKCKTKNRTSFEATMSGDKKKNQKYLNDSSLWKGKKLTVKFQGLTGKNGVPRFPVGLRIREGKE